MTRRPTTLSRHRLLRALEAEPWSTAAELAEAVGCSVQAIYSAVMRERRRGLVEVAHRSERRGHRRWSRAVYRLVGVGPRPLAARVLDVLADGEEHHARELAALTGAPYAAVDQTLRVVLARRGLVERRRLPPAHRAPRWAYRAAP